MRSFKNIFFALTLFSAVLFLGSKAFASTIQTGDSGSNSNVNNNINNNNIDCDCTPTPTPTPKVYHYTACEQNVDGFFCKDFTSNTPHDSTCKTSVDCRITPSPTPTNTPTPTPTNTPSNPGGPGDGKSDGRSDGRSDGKSSSPQPSTGGQVLGAATGPQVLGLSTTSGDNNPMSILFLLPGVVSAVGGFAFLKKNA